MDSAGDRHAATMISRSRGRGAVATTDPAKILIVPGIVSGDRIRRGRAETWNGLGLGQKPAKLAGFPCQGVGRQAIIRGSTDQKFHALGNELPVPPGKRVPGTTPGRGWRADFEAARTGRELKCRPPLRARSFTVPTELQLRTDPFDPSWNITPVGKGLALPEPAAILNP
jgi:hypothetical protein